MPRARGAGLWDKSSFPFWSPDGRRLAFRAQGELKTVDVTNGVVTQTIASGLTRFRRGAWGRDGTILFAKDVIYSVPAAGGDAVPVTRLNPSLDEVAHSAPSFLPDGRHFLYKATRASRRNGHIHIGSLNPEEPPKRLMEASRALYVPPGYILFTRERTLFARPFDARRLELTGEAEQIAEDVFYSELIDANAFDASAGGTLILRREQAAWAQLPLVWTDRAGSAATPAGLSVRPGSFDLSPDGERLAFSDGDPADIWIADIGRGSRTRLTADPDVDHHPVWSPDGSSIAFDSHRDGSRAIYEKRADGATPERALLEAGAHDVRVTDWSADGRFIVFEKDSCVGCTYDLWVLPTVGDREPFVYASSRFDERFGVLSPDGRWLAYATSESGIYQVVVQPFPDASDGKWQISTQGGTAPQWARGGEELYYYDAAGAVVRVRVQTDPTFRAGETARLFELTGADHWKVTADGERVLRTQPGAPRLAAAGADPITVILNWTALLDRR